MGGSFVLVSRFYFNRTRIRRFDRRFFVHGNYFDGSGTAGSSNGFSLLRVRRKFIPVGPSLSFCLRILSV